MDIKLVYLGLGLSLVINAVFSYFYLKRKKTLTTDARGLLNELTSGGRAIVDIRVLDPSGLFYRSPRG